MIVLFVTKVVVLLGYSGIVSGATGSLCDHLVFSTRVYIGVFEGDNANIIFNRMQ